ncbi:MAG TPA: hypothetical protein VHR17_11415 [Thermoanaerobaculia bacterium]|nr:hypothetical protein [Thermoanaerobaculia bacterium]
MSRLRPHLFALVPASIVVVYLLPIIVGSQTWYRRDLFNYHFGVKTAQARAMREGVLPLVDPLRASGQALVGNLNNVALYPDNLLYLATPPIWALNAHLWLHLLLAPVALYWLARALGIAREASWAAGFLYALSGFFLSQLNLYNLIAGTALAPAFAAACIASVSWRRPTLAAAGAGTLFGLVLVAGDPIVAALTLVLGFAVLLVKRDFDRRRLLPLALALGCGVLIAAPQIVEFLRVLPSSYRGGLGLGVESRLVSSWDPRTVIELVVPFFFGPPDQRYWGEIALRSTNRPLYFSLYPGLIAIALVIAAGRPRAPVTRLAWCLVVLGGFLALGGWNPVMFYLYRLQLAAGLRYPIKAWLLVAVGASLLAGFGFERAFRSGSRRSLLRALAVLAAGSAAAWVALTLWYRPVVAALSARITPTLPAALASAEVSRWRAALLLSLLGVALAIVLVVAARRAPRLAGCSLLALHVATQLFLLRPMFDTDTTDFYRTAPPALAYVESGERIAHGCPISLGCELGGPGSYPDWRMVWFQRRAWLELYPFVAAQFGLRNAYDVSPEGLDTVLVFAGQRALRQCNDVEALRLLAAAAVDVVVLGRPIDASAQELVRLRARLPSIAGEAWIYGLADSAPEARLAHRVRGGETRRILLEMLAPDFDPARDAFLPGGPTGIEELGGGTATIESESRERLRVQTSSETPGLLVLGRAWLPHYRAEVDGASATPIQANFGQLALEVPAGAHTVEIWVDRRPFEAALGGSGLGTLGLGALAVFGGRRRRERLAACQPVDGVKESAG